MDILALANLPIATLTFVAALWIISRIWEQAITRRDADRTRSELKNRLLSHAAFNYGTMQSTLLPVVAMLRHAQTYARQPLPPPDEPDPRGFFDWLQRGDEPGAQPGPSVQELIVRLGDFTVTKGFLDSEELAENLHRFDPQTAGLALIMIEERPMVHALIAEANALNDKPAKAEVFVAKLISLQFSCLITAVAARAIYDLEFRQEVSSALSGRSGPEAANAFFDLARKKIPGLNTLLYLGAETDTPVGFCVSELQIDATTAPLFQIEKFRTLDIARSEPGTWRYYAWPASAAVCLAILLAVPWVRGKLSSADPVTCKAAISLDGVSSAECTVTGTTLSEALGALGLENSIVVRPPRPLPDDPTGDDAEPDTGTNGAIIDLNERRQQIGE